jgi:hypothetical protein
MTTIAFGTTSGNKFQDAVAHGAVSSTLSGAVYRSDGTSDDILLDPTDLGTANAAGYWRPGSKQTWNDQAGNSNGTGSGVTIGNYGGTFANATDAVSIPDAAALRLTTPWCMEAWVKPSSFPATAYLFDKSANGTHWRWALNASTGVPVFNAPSDLAATAGPSIGEWTHLAVSWDGTTWRHYKQGVLNGSNTTPTGTLPSNTDAAYIGNRADLARSFKGMIDEVRVRNAAGYTAGFSPYRFPLNGTYSVVVDGGASEENWTGLDFTAVTSDTGNYEGAVVEIDYRASDDSTFDGGEQGFTAIGSPPASNTLTTGNIGRYLQVVFTFTPKADANRTLTPKLTSLTLTHEAGSPPPPDPLVAGTISLTNKSNTTANLSCTAATGGTAPYGYQWHRSTSSGFAPGAGNVLAGQTSLTLADTGLSAGTTYYYKLRATDSESTPATADTAELSVTTDAAATSPSRHALSFDGNWCADVSLVM